MIRISLLVVLLFLNLTSCTMIKLGISESREKNQISYQISDSLLLKSCGAITVNKTDFFPSSFLIQSGGKVIYIDPVKTESDIQADFILISHSHPDHFSISDLEKLIQPGKTVVVAPQKVISKLQKSGAITQVMLPGERSEFNELTIEALPAYNTRPVFLWIKAHPRKNNHLGYIISLPGNVRVYHAGDTDLIEEIKGIPDIDVALIPVGGDKLTMDIMEAANMVNTIKPRIMIPMHFEISRKKELLKLAELVDPAIELVLPPMEDQ
jgi:L-ascorbate metabolism protein UlaG (beta-lactamase superfamily)